MDSTYQFKLVDRHIAPPAPSSAQIYSRAGVSERYCSPIFVTVQSPAAGTPAPRLLFFRLPVATPFALIPSMVKVVAVMVARTTPLPFSNSSADPTKVRVEVLTFLENICPGGALASGSS